MPAQFAAWVQQLRQQVFSGAIRYLGLRGHECFPPHGVEAVAD
jgi:hypothetical protein